MPATIVTDCFPGKEYRGWVGFISPSAEFTPKPVQTTELRSKLVYQIRVFAKNPRRELRLGMPATVCIALDGKPSGATSGTGPAGKASAANPTADTTAEPTNQ